MPPIPVTHFLMVLKAVVVLVVTGTTIFSAIKAIDNSNDYYDRSTRTPLAPPQIPQPVLSESNPESGACPTCLSGTYDDIMRPDHDTRTDIANLLENKPTATLPHKYAFPALSILIPRATPTTSATGKAEPPSFRTKTATASSSFSENTTAPPDASTLVVLLIWCRNIFCYVAGLVSTFSANISRNKEPRTWKDMLVIAIGIVVSICLTMSITSLSLRKEKDRINRIASRDFQRLRKDHEDELIKTKERYQSAAASIEPSFGASLRNAEREVRARLNKFSIREGTREEVIDIFTKILRSFTLAMVMEESRTGGHITRYLSVIDEQNKLIESLQLLHEHREQAFSDNEDLVRSLCRYDKHGRLIIPENDEGSAPWNSYSEEEDRFITSPPDGPTALSMKVSVSSLPFHNGPSTILDTDPHWQRFLESTAKERQEQEARLASRGEVFDEEEEETGVSGETEGEAAQEVESSNKDTLGEICPDYPDLSPLERAEKQLCWRSRRLASLKAFQGTSNPKAFSDMASDSPAKASRDAAIPARDEGEGLAPFIQNSIQQEELQIEMLEIDIVHLKKVSTTSEESISEGGA